MQALEFHAGESYIHNLLNLPPSHNPTSPYLTPPAQNFLTGHTNLLITGTLDNLNRPWTSLLWGEPGFVVGLRNSSTLGLSAAAGDGDPIFETMESGEGGVDGAGGAGGLAGRKVSGLAVDLSKRRRWKLFGRVRVGRVEKAERGEGAFGKVQMVVDVEESLGNCPKYITARHLSPLRQSSPPISPPPPTTSTSLSPDAISLINNADIFFITSHSTSTDTMDTNLRGGPPGFVRILPPSTPSTPPTTLVWPDYSGNRLYQTLGNLHVNPLAGLTFTNFTTGDVLYLTGTTTLHFGPAANAILPRSSTVVEFTVAEARWCPSTLGIRETLPAAAVKSPYNPPVRYLPSEKPSTLATSTDASKASKLRLEEIQVITPTIRLFRFSPTYGGEPLAWKKGQYVTLDFGGELSSGYRHMDESDPSHLNDDYLRSWTVIDAPSTSSTTLPTTFPPTSGNATASKEVLLLVRLIPNGKVTGFLFKQRYPIRSDMYKLEVPVRGFGGEFFFGGEIFGGESSSSGDGTTIVDEEDGDGVDGGRINLLTAGVGISPVLAQLGVLESTSSSYSLQRKEKDNGKVGTLWWTVNVRDISLVRWVLEGYPRLLEVLDVHVFVTGGSGGGDNGDEVGAVRNLVEKAGGGGSVRIGRITKEDLIPPTPSGGEGARKNSKERWFVCTGEELRRQVMAWFTSAEAGEGDGVQREVVSEEFSY